MRLAFNRLSSLMATLTLGLACSVCSAAKGQTGIARVIDAGAGANGAD